jgi:hypothetical protein
MLCYSAGTRKFLFPQNMEASTHHQAFPQKRPHWLIKQWNPDPPLSEICNSVGARRSASLRHKKTQHFPLCLTMGEPCFSIKEQKMPDSPLGEESCSLLFSEWCQKACLLMRTEAQHSPLCLASGEPSLLHQRAKCKVPFWGEESCNLLLCGQHQKAYSPNCTEAQHFPPRLATGVSGLPCLRDGTSTPPLSGNILLCSCHEAGLSRCTEA